MSPSGDVLDSVPTSAVDSPVVLALDTPDAAVAAGWAAAAGPAVGMVKVGLELWCAQGPAVVAALTRAGHRVMLDLKLHDIPNTVAGAVAVVAGSGAELLTVHATGGQRMLTAAVEAAAGRLDLAVVTVLTSLDAAESARLGGPAAVPELAAAGVAAGCAAVVCSPQEAAAVRAAVGSGVRIICPGVRPAAAGDDQRRVGTPAQTVTAGADLLVVGRPITQAADVAAAAAAIRDEAVAARAAR